MATSPGISNAAAIAMLDFLVDLLDSGASNAVVQIYADSQPANPDAAVGGAVLLATLVCNDPCFGAAADDTPGALATANAISDDVAADATDTATWFRASTTNDGSTPVTAIIDGSVGTSDADMILNTINFVADANVSIVSWTVFQRES